MSKRPYSLELVTGSEEDPVSFAVNKLHIKSEADETADDELIALYAKAAVEWAETYTNRALMTQTWKYRSDFFPYNGDGYDDCGGIKLPKPPLQSVTSIKYYDGDGVLTTMPTNDYIVDAKSDPGIVFPAIGKSWPATYSGYPNAVEVIFVAGYGNGVAVPSRIKLAILAEIANLNEHRGDEMIEPSQSGQKLLFPYRILNV